MNVSFEHVFTNIRPIHGNLTWLGPKSDKVQAQDCGSSTQLEACRTKINEK